MAPVTRWQARVSTRGREWRPSRVWYWIGWVWWTFVFKVLVPMKVEGRQHIPPLGPLILAANHASGIDPFALAKASPRWPHFLAKEELFRVPVLGYVIRQWGAIPIDRSAADLGSARAALQVLRAGEVLAIFPEGTRSGTGQLGEFRPGVVNLALRKRVPVVPAATLGTGEVLPRGSRLPRLRPIRVVFGPPIHFWELLPDESEASRQAGARYLRDRVAELMQTEDVKRKMG